MFFVVSLTETCVEDMFGSLASHVVQSCKQFMFFSRSERKYQFSRENFLMNWLFSPCLLLFFQYLLCVNLGKFVEEDFAETYIFLVSLHDFPVKFIPLRYCSKITEI